MTRTAKAGELLKGCATGRGTGRFRDRFARQREPFFYRPLQDTLHISSLGMGTYLGDCDEATDQSYRVSLKAGFAAGLNIVDSAINYRCQRSERCVADAIRSAIADGTVRRDEIVVCTKGGYIPLDGQPPATRREYDAFLDAQYFSRGIMTPGDVVAGGHCIAPAYLTDQIRRSLRNLRLATIDIYYVHNPEQQLDAVPRPQFHARMREAFAVLEQAVADGLIGSYGCATWGGFRIPASNRSHLELSELVAIAREVAGNDHHFRAVQLPINLAMPEAVRSPTQTGSTGPATLLQAAAEHGIAVIASATLMQGQLTRNLPAKIRDAFPTCSTDAQCAADFTRGLPSVTSALIGMRTLAHLDEQLAAAIRRAEPDVAAQPS